VKNGQASLQIMVTQAGPINFPHSSQDGRKGKDKEKNLRMPQLRASPL
jgi:hypothetical protein